MQHNTGIKAGNMSDGFQGAKVRRGLKKRSETG